VLLSGVVQVAVWHREVSRADAKSDLEVDSAEAA
jgi:hypothetical protein